MAIITIELKLESEDSATIAAALDEISNSISESGYNESEFETGKDTNNKRFDYRIIKGYSSR